MENHVHASTAAKFRRLVMLAMAACLALAGLISAFAPVQAQAAEEIEITHDGTLPARWRVYWEATFSADGGTAPYTCSMTGTAPGLTFNTETCSLSGAPTQYGTFPITVTFVDSKGAAGTLDLNFEVQAKTNLALTLSSLHPDGPSVYMAGYPVRVRAVVDFSPTDPQKIPTGQVTFQAGTDGPSCTADLDLGVADCDLVISEAGEWTITATYAGGSTIESSEDSKTITLKPLQVTPVLSAGYHHTCYLDETGWMRCWGLADSFPVDENDRPVPQGPFVRISAGGYQTCALKTDGTIACSGENTEITHNIPTGQFVELSAGTDHVCAIDASGKLKCWGDLTEDLAKVPTAKVSAVSAGAEFDCAIQANNGYPVCWGEMTGSPTPNVKVIDLAVGNTHACAVKENHELVCWGSPSMDLPAGNDFQTVESGSNYSCAADSDGKLICFGSGKPAVDTNVTVELFSSGFLHTCAVVDTGGQQPTLSCWGANDYGKAPRIELDPAELPSILMIGKAFEQTFTATGGNAPYSLTLDGGSLPHGLTLANGAITGTPNRSGTYTFTLKAAETFSVEDGILPLQLTPLLRQYTVQTIDGTTTTSLQLPDQVTAGSPALAQVTVSGGPASMPFEGSVRVESADQDAYCEADVDNTGKAQCFLYFSTAGQKTVTAKFSGESYRLPSQGSDTIIVNPAEIHPLVAAGGAFSCSVDGNGRLTCWGKNDSGQAAAPAGVFDRLSLGQSHACAIGLNRRTTCWGWNGFGNATPPDMTGVLQVTAGDRHTCALDGEGGVTCWGDSTYGQTEGAYGKFTAVAAYDDHTCALRGDSQLICWGEDDAGEAPQYSFNQMTAKRVTALTYFEHVFDIDGGIRPIAAVVAEGSLPPGLDLTDPSDIPNRGNRAGDAVNDLSPAGMVLYGVPRMPGTYSFVIRWKDSSPVPLVMEQPYTLTVTGADLSVAFEAATVGDALEGLDYAFNVRVTNGTVFPVPDVVLTITSSAGISDLRSVHPGCAVQGQAFVCALGEILSGKAITDPVVGKVTAKNGESFQLNASVSSTNPDWPEVDPLDNLSTVMVLVASRTGVFSDDFEQSSANGWTGGFRITAPNGQTLLAPVSDNGLRLDLTNLPDHQRVTVSFDLYVAGSWLGNNPGGLPYKWRFGLAGAYPRLRTTFPNIPGMQQAYPRSLGQGSFPAMTGADGVNLLGIVQEDGSPVPDALYRMSFTFQHTAPDLSLVFESLNLPEGAAWALDSVRIEADTGWTQVYLPAVSATR